ncbi:MAG: BirA family transcriptional regulator [Pseudonocardiales bacterium]|jgi:BirA family biotin operon repressor/biotin-[acetyl-CoA-carboxylase] ligase|nr:BirA family transcriptional regulator [Pseudonocardiales bacterium]
MTDPLSDPLPDADELGAALGGRWARVTVVAETASTNTDLLADTSAPDRCVLVTEHQAAGRGRLDRSWVSPPGAGLTFSVLLRPPVTLLRWGWLPLLAGVALYEAVSAVEGVQVALKWPNDLLAGSDADQAASGKVAGILAQTSGEAVVIGIGLNVHTHRADLPVESATSLALCGAPALDRGELLAAILTRLDARYAQWVDVDGDAEACGLAAAYREACSTVGQVVTVTETDGKVVRGTAIGIDSSGRLQVDVGGTTQVIGAGDVEHVRPA